MVLALGTVRKTHLTGGVDDVTVIVDALVVDGLVEDTLDGGIVGLDEVVLDELNDERRLPCKGARRDGGRRAVSGDGRVNGACVLTDRARPQDGDLPFVENVAGHDGEDGRACAWCEGEGGERNGGRKRRG